MISYIISIVQKIDMEGEICMLEKSLLERKELIQKSFRIEKKLDEALSELSKILNRSQNELIDYAIRLLIEQNKGWFAEDFVGEYYHKIIDQLYEPKTEMIKDYELSFLPYDYRTGKGAFLVLLEHVNEEINEVFREDVGNDPGTNSRIKNALGKIALLIAKKYPELKEKYKISNIDV